jgi:hypothetical protein
MQIVAVLTRGKNRGLDGPSVPGTRTGPGGGCGTEYYTVP